MKARFKRFYETVSLEPTEAGFAIQLDGRPVRTPGGKPLAVPASALGEAVAAEWRDARDEVAIDLMAMSRLSNAAIDHVAPRLAEVRQEALAYAKSDVLCYRASEPQKLRARQDAAWQPPLDWLAERFGARLTVAHGLFGEAASPEALARLSARLEAIGPFPLLAVRALTTAYGSLVLALGVLEDAWPADAAHDLSRLDEIYQIEDWGEDAEALARTRRIAGEVGELARFLSLLKD